MLHTCSGKRASAEQRSDVNGSESLSFLANHRVSGLQWTRAQTDAYSVSICHGTPLATQSATEREPTTRGHLTSDALGRDLRAIIYLRKMGRSERPAFHTMCTKPEMTSATHPFWPKFAFRGMGRMLVVRSRCAQAGSGAVLDRVLRAPRIIPS